MTLRYPFVAATAPPRAGASFLSRLPVLESARIVWEMLEHRAEIS